MTEAGLLPPVGGFKFAPRVLGVGEGNTPGRLSSGVLRGTGSVDGRPGVTDGKPPGRLSFGVLRGADGAGGKAGVTGGTLPGLSVGGAVPGAADGVP
jgi:hypothetical protein